MSLITIVLARSNIGVIVLAITLVDDVFPRPVLPIITVITRHSIIDVLAFAHDQALPRQLRQVDPLEAELELRDPALVVDGKVDVLPVVQAANVGSVLVTCVDVVDVSDGDGVGSWVIIY